MGKHEKERDGFKSRTGFVLACIGSAVGMGNIWRFPYMVSDWGGMTFLLPYILFVILIASTGVIEEMALGRAAKGVILSILVYTLFSRMFDLMQPPAVKHSIAVV